MAEGKICAVDGCDFVLGKTHGRICPKHRARFFRYGSYDFVSPNWTQSKKGQPCSTANGRIRVHVNGKRVLQHRLIMEQHLGRPLARGECVHHKNGDPTDNRIENLELQSSHSEHMKTHHRHSWRNRKVRPPYTPEVIAKILHCLSLPSHGIGRNAPQGIVCFCGNPMMARNLCSKHYQWAYKHKFT